MNIDLYGSVCARVFFALYVKDRVLYVIEGRSLRFPRRKSKELAKSLLRVLVSLLPRNNEIRIITRGYLD